MFALTRFLLTKKKINVFSVVVLFGSEVRISEFQRGVFCTGRSGQRPDSGTHQGGAKHLGAESGQRMHCCRPLEVLGSLLVDLGLFVGSSHRVQPSGQVDSPHVSGIDGQSQPVYTPEPIHLQVPDASWLMAAEAGPGRGAELQHHTC